MLRLTSLLLHCQTVGHLPKKSQRSIRTQMAPNANRINRIVRDSHDYGEQLDWLPAAAGHTIQNPTSTRQYSARCQCASSTACETGLCGRSLNYYRVTDSRHPANPNIARPSASAKYTDAQECGYRAERLQFERAFPESVVFARQLRRWWTVNPLMTSSHKYRDEINKCILQFSQRRTNLLKTNMRHRISFKREEDAREELDIITLTIYR
ncbi:hypothetical protein V9T40_000062 [Parthenolecanium corni]|uniref:Uncharacterized protein n=1 Tax=Parthenolecanium corni TaxID=536013 RepID=A0AAN9TFU5_9HEMI